MKVIITRGIPGSGKTTWVRTILENGGWDIVSADDYHMIGKQYRFDPKNAGAAHNACLRQYLNLLDPGSNYGIIVDNTNTTAWEISPYYQAALALGAEVKIVRVCCPFEVAVRRNVHDVPPNRVWQMHQNLITERLPPHWVEEFVFSGEQP